MELQFGPAFLEGKFAPKAELLQPKERNETSLNGGNPTNRPSREPLFPAARAT